jgi:guanylate kinase
MNYTIEKQGRSWAIMQGLRVVSLCVSLEQAQKRLEELNVDDKQKIILLEAELRLLRDWRDTWLDERTRVFKENDKLRQALSKVSSIISKVDLGQYKSTK